MFRNRLWAMVLIVLAFTYPGMTAGAAPAEVLGNASILQFSGEERISRPSVFDIDISTPNKALNFESLIGKSLSITPVPGLTLSGMIERIEQTGVSREAGTYHIRLVSGLNRLSYRVSSRTFYDMSISDIITTVLNDAGVRNSVFNSNRNTRYDFVIQYRESDLAFINRLIEGAGIHYHFVASGTEERIVFSDSNQSFSGISGQLKFSAAERPSVLSFQRGSGLYSGMIQSGDYSWTQPALNLTSSAQSNLFTDLVDQDRPAGILIKPELDAKARILLEAQIAGSRLCRGTSTYPSLKAGSRFALTGYPRQDFNQEYVVTSVRHTMGRAGYQNSFTCIPTQVPYRDKMDSPKPVIAGIVPGVVAGPAGSRKYVNKYGQVRVRFPWRGPASAQATSGDAGWVRVLQPAAGSGATSMWLPDIGDEVAVAFEHGNPDRPVVIGGLYNGASMPPFALPAESERSLFRVQSAAGKTTEILFDNTAGKESLMLRSGNQAITINQNGIAATSPIMTPASSAPARKSVQPSR